MNINIKSLVEEGKAKKIKGYKHYYALDIGEIYSNYSKRCIDKRQGRKNKDGTFKYYACCLFKDSKAKKFYIHSLVAKYFLGERPEGTEIDHINENKHDNRAKNLRYLTKPQNAMNRGKQVNNTTGYKGVTRILNSKKQVIGYEAQLCRKGKPRVHSRHTFSNSKPNDNKSEHEKLKVEAAKSYDKIVYEIYGSGCAYFNFPKLINEYK
jgi:hypothetical protein|tara:strand:+ start:560 stop:1186 length:627 start_codon:yes stop_codon:yes gene_type:complete